jgi:drug/metabolite transporter (DMT)-like permease
MSAGANRPLYGTALVAGAALCWSSAGLLSRLVATDSWTTMFWRSLTSAIFLFAALWVTRRRELWRSFATLFGSGLTITLSQAMASISFILALMNTTVATALIIMATAPLFAALLARLFLGEPIWPKTAAATVVAIAGIGIMVSENLAPGRLFGNGMALLAAVSFAALIVTMRRHREVELVPAVSLAAFATALVSLPIAGSHVAASPRDLGLLTLFGVGEQGLGLLLFTYGVRHIPAIEVALIGLIESILAPIWVWIFIGEAPGPRTLVGAAVVIAALLINTLADLRRSGPLTQPSR